MSDLLTKLRFDPQRYSTAAAILLGVLGFISVMIVNIRRNGNRKYPPGPKGVPIFGNLLQLSTTPWLEFEQWKKEYGPLVYLNVAGQSMLILNTHKTAVDLFDRRANKYSERPRWFVASEHLTGGLFPLLSQRGNNWKKLRSAGQELLNKTTTAKFYAINIRDAVDLVQNLLQDSKDWPSEIGRASSSTISSIIYGLPPFVSRDDLLIQKTAEFTNQMGDALYHGTHFVDFFPWMNYMPSAVAPWKRKAQEYFMTYSNLLEGLFRDVQKRIDHGDEMPSFASSWILERRKHDLGDLGAWWLSGTFFATGVTTSVPMLWFLFAMVLYPDKQKKCQEELDVVVGRSQMPTFEDRANLPYLNATVREVLRWRPIARIGGPHCTCEDDWYQGYFIPKGTICIPNMWSMNRDPEVYGPDANHFNPDRFINEKGELLPAIPDTKDEGHVSFGFGPRICVGRHLANNTLFINIACLLWATNILPIIDEGTGKPILPDSMGGVKSGILVHPLPFECKIEPRFPEVEGILALTKPLYA